MTPQRPVLRYFGGKWILAPWIISHLPPHRIYVEPFGGAASVLMRKPRSYAEIYNDLDGEVVNVFRVMRDKSLCHQLRAALELTPFAREEFEISYSSSSDPVEQARRTIIRSFMGFGSNAVDRESMTGFRANSNRSGTTPAHDWSNYPPNLVAYCERLSGVAIENRDAIEVMAQQDSDETLHFVDPPYVHETRGTTSGYRYEMTDEQHVKLIEALNGLRGSVVLCGYDSPLYDRLQWNKITRSAHADGAQDRVEVLWLNPKAWDGQAQMAMSLEGA